MQYEWKGKKAELDAEDKDVLSFAILTMIKLMSPVAVHLCEEAWNELGGAGSIHAQKWPEWNDDLAKASSITLIVQVNGKLRDKIEADESSSEDDLKALALNSERVKEFTDGKTIVKTIVVPKKLVNIVVK